MGQQCGCFPDSAQRKLMHGIRVSAGKEKGHTTALFLAHEDPGIGIGDCRVALRGRAEYAAGTIPAAESIRAGEVSQAPPGITGSDATTTTRASWFSAPAPTKPARLPTKSP